MVALINWTVSFGSWRNSLRHLGHPLLSLRKRLTQTPYIYSLLLTPAGHGLLHFQHGLFPGTGSDCGSLLSKIIVSWTG